MRQRHPQSVDLSPQISHAPLEPELTTSDSRSAGRIERPVLVVGSRGLILNQGSYVHSRWSYVFGALSSGWRESKGLALVALYIVCGRFSSTSFI